MPNASSPTEIVLEFIKVWEAQQYDRFGEFLTDESVFHMVPIDPVRGIPAIVEECRKLDGLGETDIRILNVAAAGNIVFTERIDALKVGDRVGELPLSGVFELNDDGKILEWRDYFDMQQALKEFGADEVL